MKKGSKKKASKKKTAAKKKTAGKKKTATKGKRKTPSKKTAKKRRRSKTRKKAPPTVLVLDDQPWNLPWLNDLVSHLGGSATLQQPRPRRYRLLSPLTSKRTSSHQGLRVQAPCPGKVRLKQ